MSDLMLFAVLEMPYDMAMESELSRRQFYSRVQTLVARVKSQDKAQEALLKACDDVMRHIEAAHRPPVKDALEGGRMARVRLHSLADLNDAVVAARLQPDVASKVTKLEPLKPLESSDGA